MKRILKNTLRWLPILALLAVGFNNCAPSGGGDSGSVDSASVGQPAPEVDSEKLGIPIALLSAEQTLQSMLSVTNTSTASAATLTEYNDRYGALAAGNDLSMANGPLMIGATSLAGEVCNNMITQEKAAATASRNFYGSVNFAAGISSLDDLAFRSSIRGMARSFWGRNETMEEYTLLLQYKNDFSAALAANARTQAASTSNVLLALCAAMLSSLDSISY
ncbi:hypothetical protein [Bdellovibrio sp. HCB2-146]|uniref:hypothetical protein n=1 Tax=Bdellovibrio sp. HCB2-146 TaxID=3394362 RepID=UPI0039BCF1BE